MDANLLAGRAINRTFFPLVWDELGGAVAIDDILTCGLLPAVRSDPEAAIDILEAYATNYLRERSSRKP